MNNLHISNQRNPVVVDNLMSLMFRHVNNGKSRIEYIECNSLWSDEIGENKNPGTIKVIAHGEKETSQKIYASIKQRLGETAYKQHIIILGNHFNDKQIQYNETYTQGGSFINFWKPFGSLFRLALKDYPLARWLQGGDGVYDINRENCLYMASHKIIPREKGWDQICDGIPDCHAGGQCNGLKQLAKKVYKNYRPNLAKNNLWGGNIDFCKDYRLVYCPDNHFNKTGYITEKIVIALLAGCVPIYEGYDDIGSVFNPDRIIRARWDWETHVGFENIQDVIKQSNNIINNDTHYSNIISKPIMSTKQRNEFFGLAGIAQYINNI